MLREHLNIGAAEENVGVYWRIAIHEAGHAVIGAALKLGHISSMQITEFGGSITRDGVRTQSLLIDIEDEIAYAMGGRAAERLVFGEVSSGAGGPKNSDLAKATRYALDIEATYGLGCAGPVWHATPEAVHLANSAVRDRVRIRIERAEKRAGIILEQNRDVLDALARNLLKKRSMRSQEIQHFLQSVIVIGTHPKTEAAVHPAFENHANQA
jgi:cell division protease FtsH